MELYYYIMFWISLMGLCLGSFYNVVILRSLSNESIIFPPSKCPKCNNKLKMWHNIPVVSYILLKGKCYYCKERISAQYPIVELVTMLLFLFAYIKFGFSYNFLFIIMFLSCLLIMTVTDIKEQLVDCKIAILMGMLGLLFYYINFREILPAIYGIVAAIVFFELIAATGYLFVKSRAMGEADTYVAAALGACFGLNNLLYILAYSLIFALIVVIPVFFYKQFVNGNKLCCLFGILFILSLLIYKFLLLNYLGFALVFISAIGLIHSFLKNIGKQENQTYLPFVPALFIGALSFIFFQLKL